MKPTIVLLSLSALPLSTAWKFTWRDSSGKTSTEKGTGPSECIAVNHAKGQLFVLDGEGEENINMLLFSNDECEGEPAGKATVSFAKEASVDLKGFQVVEYRSSGSANGNATTTASVEDGTVTLPTVSATSTSTDDEDGTVTLPTVPATTTNGTSTVEPTTTTATETGSDSQTPSTEPTSTESAGGEEEPTPTGASSRLVPLSLAGLIAVGLGVAGGF
ncbi:hypothetical protein BDW75DRAFT_240299 [Aspergillus navahoensis]